MNKETNSSPNIDQLGAPPESKNENGDPSITIEMVDGKPREVRKLTFDPTLGKYVPAGAETPKRKKLNCKFCQFYTSALYRIARDTHNAELVILTTLYELWFSNFKQNPVKLNAEWFRKLGFERRYIYQALKRLEKSDQISAERRTGKCTLVTLNESLWR